jgi:hypothetical protein
VRFNCVCVDMHQMQDWWVYFAWLMWNKLWPWMIRPLEITGLSRKKFTKEAFYLHIWPSKCKINHRIKMARNPPETTVTNQEVKSRLNSGAIKGWNFSTSKDTVSFSVMNVLHGINYIWLCVLMQLIKLKKGYYCGFWIYILYDKKRFYNFDDEYLWRFHYL